MFGTEKKYTLILILIFLCFYKNAYCSFLTESEEEIKCPHSENLKFPYYRFDQEDQKNTDLTVGYVLQGNDVDTLTEDECHLYILPYVSPCTGIIAVYDKFIDNHKKNKPIFLAHKDHAIRYSSICEKMLAWITKIDSFDKNLIKVTLFTSTHSNYDLK